MAKSKNWSDEAIAWETGTGEFDREGTTFNREFGREHGYETKYVAPEPDQKWRARDLLDIHWNLTGIKCSVSFNRIMSCIVGHVNVKTGACFPKQTTIGIETGCSRSTVRRAVEWWSAHKFLKTEDRGLAHALAYHPQFKLFDMYYVAVTDDITAQKQKMEHACVIKGEHGCVTKGNHDVVQYGDAHNLKEETSKENLKEESLHEVVRPPSVADTHLISSSEGKEQEGIQGEQVGKPSPTPQVPSPAGPLFYEEAEQAVMAAMGHFEWSHHTSKSYQACIETEMAAPGSGVAAVKAIAAEAWRKKRSNAK